MLSQLELKGRCLERLMQMSADGFVLVDADSIIIEISQAYCEKLGRTRADTTWARMSASPLWRLSAYKA